MPSRVLTKYFLKRYGYTVMAIGNVPIAKYTFFSKSLSRPRSTHCPACFSPRRSRPSLPTRMYSSTITFLQVLLLPLVFNLFRPTSANVTVYDYGGPVTSTVSGAQPAYTGLQAYNPILLKAPPLPSPAPSNNFNVSDGDSVYVSYVHVSSI